MGGTTFFLTPVIRDEFSQWADTIDWTVRCDWLQVASVVPCSLQVESFNLYRSVMWVLLCAVHYSLLREWCTG